MARVPHRVTHEELQKKKAAPVKAAPKKTQAARGRVIGARAAQSTEERLPAMMRSRSHREQKPKDAPEAKPEGSDQDNGDENENAE